MPTRLNPDEYGAFAETSIASAAMKRGVHVYKPMAEGGKFDLILEQDGRLLRVQCKAAKRVGGVVLVNCRTCRRSADGVVRRTYSADEIDAVAAFCPDTERCYLLLPALFEGRSMVSLRLKPTKNNQSSRVNWAHEYDFDATLGPALLGP